MHVTQDKFLKKKKKKGGFPVIPNNIASKHQVAEESILWKTKMIIQISIWFVKSSPEGAEAHLSFHMLRFQNLLV